MRAPSASRRKRWTWEYSSTRTLLIHASQHKLLRRVVQVQLFGGSLDVNAADIIHDDVTPQLLSGHCRIQRSMYVTSIAYKVLYMDQTSAWLVIYIYIYICGPIPCILVVCVSCFVYALWLSVKSVSIIMSVHFTTFKTQWFTEYGVYIPRIVSIVLKAITSHGS